MAVMSIRAGGSNRTQFGFRKADAREWLLRVKSGRTGGSVSSRPLPADEGTKLIAAKRSFASLF
jgi:hypothetical protein